MTAEAAATLVEAVVEDARWDGVGIGARAETAASAALSAAGLDPARCELSLLACDDARIAVLNGSFRGKPAATNVLSWPAFEGGPPAPGPARDGEEPLFLGDLAIAYDTCAAEAAAAGVTLADHATHLVVHGVLHLLGHDHEDDGEAEVMEAIETKVLASLGIDDPYSR